MNTQEPCPRIEGLSALVDDELRPAEREALDSHVAACPLCAPVLAELRQLRTRFAALPDEAMPVDVTSEVMRRIDALGAGTPVQAPRPARRRWWQVALLAPGGAVAVTAGVWLGIAALPVAGGPVAAPAAQMAVFSTQPPGALCPALRACGGGVR